MTKSWSDEETLSIILLYKDRPWLWDSAHKDYKNKNKRHDGLMEIAISFGVDKGEVERKIKNVVSHFWRERRKENDSMKTGSGAEEIYTSKWFAMPALMFIVEKNQVRGTVDTDPGSLSRVGEQCQSVENPENGSNKGDTDTDGLTSNTPVKTPRKSPNKKSFVSPRKTAVPVKRKIGMSTPVINEAIDLMKSISAKKKDKDEFDLFGEQVAIKLRKLCSPHAQFMAQNIINNTLYEASTGAYDAQRPFNAHNLAFSPTTSQPSPSYTSMSSYQSPGYSPQQSSISPSAYLPSANVPPTATRFANSPSTHEFAATFESF